MSTTSFKMGQRSYGDVFNNFVCSCRRPHRKSILPVRWYFSFKAYQKWFTSLFILYIVSNSALLLLDGNNAFMESYLLFSTEYDGSCRDHILIAAHASFLHSLILLRDSSISWCLFQCQCTQTMLLINTWLTWVGIRFLISLSMYLIVMSPSRAEGFSARLGSWPFSLQLEIENWPKTSRNFDFDFFFFLVYVAKS